MGILVSIGGWLLGRVLSLGSSNLVQRALDIYNKVNNSEIRGKAIEADVTKNALEAIVSIKKIESEVTKDKMSFKWFWVFAALLLGPVVIYFWALTAYNIFWHANGIWPQEWNIAAFPKPYDQWATQAFSWVFAPAMGVGSILAVLNRKK